MALKLSHKTVDTKIRVLRQQISSLERTLKSFSPMLGSFAAASFQRSGGGKAAWHGHRSEHDEARRI